MRNTPILALKTPAAAGHAIPDGYGASSGAETASMRGRCYTGGTRERIRTAERPQRALCHPIDPVVGHRLAAFADGEGCFSIARTAKTYSGGRKGFHYQCSFVVKLRADDKPLLERFQRETGLGNIYDIKARPTPGRDNNAAVKWGISRHADKAALVAIFDEYPLWSKKAREFAIWRVPVLLAAEGRVRQRDLEFAFNAIREVRKYPNEVAA